jgi:hypothetical protein
VHVVIPPIRIVVGDEDDRVLPFGSLLNPVDGDYQECLLIQRIGIARVAIAISGRLEKTHCWKISRLHRVEEIVEIILMMGRLVSIASDGSNRGRPSMRRVP